VCQCERALLNIEPPPRILIIPTRFDSPSVTIERSCHVRSQNTARAPYSGPLDYATCPLIGWTPNCCNIKHVCWQTTVSNDDLETIAASRQGWERQVTQESTLPSSTDADAIDVRRRDVSRRHTFVSCGHLASPRVLSDDSEPPIVPDAILDQRRPKWITRIVDSSLFAHRFFCPRTPLPRYISEKEINRPAGSSRKDSSFRVSCARRLEEKGQWSMGWAHKALLNVEVPETLRIKSIDRDQAHTRWWHSASARAFSRQRRHIVRHWPLTLSRQTKRQFRQPHPPAPTFASARSSPLAQPPHLPSGGSTWNFYTKNRGLSCREGVSPSRHHCLPRRRRCIPRPHRPPHSLHSLSPHKMARRR